MKFPKRTHETSDFSFQFELYSVTSLVLGCVQSGIRAGHKRVPVRRLTPAKSCDSKASGRRHSVIPESKLRVFKLFTYSFDCSLRALFVCMGHHYQKFLSSQSSTHVRLACVHRQNLRECLECGVARIVPVGVVDLLEKIQVGHHCPKRKTVPGGCTQFAGCPNINRTSVGQAC